MCPCSVWYMEWLFTCKKYFVKLKYLMILEIFINIYIHQIFYFLITLSCFLPSFVFVFFPKSWIVFPLVLLILINSFLFNLLHFFLDNLIGCPVCFFIREIFCGKGHSPQIIDENKCKIRSKNKWNEHVFVWF